jgi:hypothetical protein
MATVAARAGRARRPMPDGLGQRHLAGALGGAMGGDAAPDRVDVADDVVDHDAHRRTQAEQRDRREGASPQVEDVGGHDERHRNRDEADHRRSPRDG